MFLSLTVYIYIAFGIQQSYASSTGAIAKNTEQPLTLGKLIHARPVHLSYRRDREKYTTVVGITQHLQKLALECNWNKTDLILTEYPNYILQYNESPGIQMSE